MIQGTKVLKTSIDHCMIGVTIKKLKTHLVILILFFQQLTLEERYLRSCTLQS